MLKNVIPSGTWGRAMPWWQGPTYHGLLSHKKLNVIEYYTARVITLKTIHFRRYIKLLSQLQTFWLIVYGLYSQNWRKETRYLLQNSEEPLISHPTASNCIPLCTQFAPGTIFFYWLMYENFFNNDWPEFKSLEIKIKYFIGSALQSLKQLNRTT